MYSLRMITGFRPRDAQANREIDERGIESRSSNAIQQVDHSQPFTAPGTPFGDARRSCRLPTALSRGETVTAVPGDYFMLSSVTSMAT